jgi:hypothetical protein
MIVDRAPNQGATRTRHPRANVRADLLHVRVKLPATSMLLQEGLEVEQQGHGCRIVARAKNLK